MNGRRDFRPEERCGPGIASPLEIVEGFLDEDLEAAENPLTGATIIKGTLIAWQHDEPLTGTDQGTWNATTNTPTLASGVGDEGDYYVCSVAGSTTLDGLTAWAIDDVLYFTNGAWIRPGIGTLCGTDQGEWNASTNSPALASGVGTTGHFYRVSVSGSTSLDSISTWVAGQYLQFDGTAWVRRAPVLFETATDVWLVNRDNSLSALADSYFVAAKINGEFRIIWISCGIVRP